MSQPRSRQVATLVLVFGAVVFGMMLAGGLNLTSPSISAPAANAAAPAAPAGPAVTPSSIQGLPSFADLADQVLPAVVSIEAVTIEKSSNRRGQPGDPFEFFFGPQRRPRQSPDDQGGGEPEEYRQDAGGSGFVISADGWIVTNNHVIEGATSVKVHLGDRNYPAEVKGADRATDLALLKIDAGGALRYLDLGDSDHLRVGDWVMVVGNPLNLDQTVTTGVVSAKGRQIGINDRSFENFIQTDAAINRGNSGGPLVDMSGRVVGIATAMNWGAENIGFAVPVDTLREVLPQLRDKGKVSRGYLGVQVGNIDYEQQQAFGLASRDGALVSSVEDGTPAADAGLQHGDVIVEVDGHPVKDTRQLISYVSQKGPDSKVEVLLLRDGKRMQKTVKLGERPSGEEEADNEEGGSQPSGTQWLGLQYQDLTASLRKSGNVPDGVEGVYVSDVAPSSPLYEEGLREGDIVTEVSGTAVKKASDFEAVVKGAKSGSYLRLYVRRFDPRSPRDLAFFAIVRVP
jgi:serine protease Do